MTVTCAAMEKPVAQGLVPCSTVMPLGESADPCVSSVLALGPHCMSQAPCEGGEEFSVRPEPWVDLQTHPLPIALTLHSGFFSFPASHGISQRQKQLAN